jgi:hypothetical protein
MSKRSEDLMLELSAHEAVSACRDAITMVGWKEDGPAGVNRVVVRVGFGFFRNPSRIEMLISEAGEKTKVRLNGSIKQFGPVADRALGKQLAQIRSAIEVAALRHGDGLTGSEAAPSLAPSSESVEEPESVEERLAKLAQMNKDSLITDAEYAEQRKRVLRDL